LQKLRYIDIGGDPEKVQNKFDVKMTPAANYTEMTSDHMSVVYKLYNEYMIKYNVCYNYTESELSNVLLNDFVKSYIVMDKDNNIVDFTSYYKTSYSVTGSDEKIISGNLFLYTCNSTACDELVENMLKFAKINELDLFSVNDTMMIQDVLFTKDYSLDEDSDVESYDRVFEHKFVRSTKTLFFNFFNWKCPTMKSKQLSIPSVF
jgi:hypothetical protein